MSALFAALEKIRASKLNPTTGTYTPLITAAAGSPAVGAGFLTGKYVRNYSKIWFYIDMFISAGTIAGTSWRITLPFAADLTFHTAGTLGAASDAIGNYQTSSGTAAQALTGTCLLSGPSGTDNTGTAVIFYSSGSTASIGSSSFTTTARIKAWGIYYADPALF
jgi:hypothetical protein